MPRWRSGADRDMDLGTAFAFACARRSEAEAFVEGACLAGGLARYKRPRDYVLVGSIPRSPSG